MMKDYILKGYNPEKFLANLDLIADLYREYGVVILPQFFNNDPSFNNFISDLNKIFNQVISRHTNEKTPDDLGEKLVMLVKHKGEDGKIITDLGTQPNKFNSFNFVKYSPCVEQILNKIYGDNSIMVTPQAGDTLHFFAPGEAFHRYNLPPHQDYQYLMQSPEQITFYLGLSKYKDNVGGLRIWEKSHKLGIINTTKNKFGSFEVHDHESALKGFEQFDYEWNQGDFGLFDSLLAHSSIPNYSQDSGRVVQIFRFSNINNDTARSYDYRSTAYPRRSVSYTDLHSDLYIEPEENNTTAKTA